MLKWITLGLTEEVEERWLSDRRRLGGTRFKHPMKGILQRGEVPRMPAPRHSASLSFGLHKFSLRDMDQVAPDLPNNWNGLWSDSQPHMCSTTSRFLPSHHRTYPLRESLSWLHSGLFYFYCWLEGNPVAYLDFLHRILRTNGQPNGSQFPTW